MTAEGLRFSIEEGIPSWEETVAAATSVGPHPLPVARAEGGPVATLAGAVAQVQILFNDLDDVPTQVEIA